MGSARPVFFFDLSKIRLEMAGIGHEESACQLQCVILAAPMSLHLDVQNDNFMLSRAQENTRQEKSRRNENTRNNTAQERQNTKNTSRKHQTNVRTAKCYFGLP